MPFTESGMLYTGYTEHDLKAFDAADRAVETVGENANELWMRKARRSLTHVARMNASFTTDDVWADMLLVDEFAVTHEPRAMGAVLRRAVKAGVCVATPRYQPSVRVECHARPVRVWRSLVYTREG